jgi:hypothetical protein
MRRKNSFGKKLEKLGGRNGLRRCKKSRKKENMI